MDSASHRQARRSRSGSHPRLRGHLRSSVLAGITVGGAFVLTGGLLTLGARIIARIALVPQGDLRQRPDTEVRAAYPDRLHLDATAETARNGVIALRQSGGAVHVRLGAVTGRPTARTVSRPILAQDTAEGPRVGRARTNGFFWAGTPWTAHSLDTREVQVQSPVGQMPAWLVAADPERARRTGADGTWAVLIHGHGATRGEALRLIPLLHELGITTLAITYRNDVGAPASADALYHLGSAEWEDADAAVQHALDAGAQRVVLVGWSMGGGIALRTAVKSPRRDAIASVVLDSPAVDWTDILVHHANALRAPRVMQRMALWMMASGVGHRTIALREPLALLEMRPEFYADHLQVPTLLLHALDDTTVPVGPSRRLAALAHDRVRFEGFEGASHTREWNRDPERYERVVADHMARTLGLRIDVSALDLPVRNPGTAPGPHATGERR